MSDDPRNDDDVISDRVARILRVPERFDDNFEAALVEAIRADRPIRRRLAKRTRPLAPAWWSMPITVRFSPLSALAVAASLATIASLATLRMALPPTTVAPPMVAEVVHDTVHLVRFVFVGKASSVSLVGDFNAWGAQPVQLSSNGSNDAWTVSVPLPSGRHEYAFIVDGKQWVADPFAPTTSDEFNTKSSVIAVGT
jgi:hypothetical protein